MSNLSGYDSETVGFDSIQPNKNTETTSSTQTTDFKEFGVGIQTNTSKDHGCNVCPDDLNAQNRILTEYPPPGLNEFLRKVVPGVLEQLDQNSKEILYNSSDSEEEDLIGAKLLQEINLKDGVPPLGSGDHQTASVLSVSWSGAGNSVAVSLGRTYHENWCEHDGIIRIYTLRRSEGDKFVHNLDITEKNCITVLKYHPLVAALLAYGTTSGEVVLCNLRNVNSNSLDQTMQLSSPSGFHSSNRVSAMQWADAPLANKFLMIHILDTGKRRGASDQVLITSGSDGSVNAWQVNANMQVFENILCYKIDGSKKMPAPDISCFDFIKSFPLRPPDEKCPDDVFIVGTTSGKLYLCNMQKYNPIVDSTMVDPVYEVLEGHSTCILDVAFSFHKTGIFASISMDSELRVYDIRQTAPLKVLCMDDALSCMGWVPNNPSLVIVGLAKVDKQGQVVKVYDVSSGRDVPVEGLTTGGEEGVTITSLAVHQSGSCQIAAGDTNSSIRIWDMPLRRLKLTQHDLEF